MGNITAPGINKFGSVTGGSVAKVLESVVESLWPNTSDSCDAQNLSVRTVGGDITIALRVNGINTAVSCATSGGTCTSSGTFEIPANARVSMAITAGTASQALFAWECLQ